MPALSPSDEMTFARPARLPLWIMTLLLAITVLVTAYEGFVADTLASWTPVSTTLLALVSLVVWGALGRKHFSIGFLLSLLPFLINWRVGVMQSNLPITVISTITFVYYCLLFVDAMMNDLANYKENGWFGALQWQMTLVRIFFGYDMVGHFTEKMFAGSESFVHMTTVFANYNVPFPALFVILGGLCELATAIGVGAGFFSRLAGFLAATYFLVSNHIGGHDLNGFTWNSKPNGGWEYAVLMAVYFISFTFSGSGKFSLDGWLVRNGWMPSSLKPFVASKGERIARAP